ncbi:MAG: hypothetical protein H6Q30_2532 [Bacteroidetes bacterium]|nr:hypothetical protein [Bacteroidota bacterium]
MPTVMLTAKCVNSCEWCFARAKMAEYRSRGISELGLSEFASVVDFYVSSGAGNMILLGGEPLLHSRFTDVLEMLRSRGFSVSVSTTGICAKRLVDRIAAVRFPALTFLLNSTSYFHYSPAKRRRVDYFVQHIGHPVVLGYTITERDLDQGNPFAVVDRIGLIMKFSLFSHLQFQIAVPGKDNSLYIPMNRYPELMDLLQSWFRILRQNKVSYGVDCHSFPRCAMRAQAEDGELFRSTCDCFMIDIGPGPEAWPCFPLSDHAVALDHFRSLDEVRSYFHRKINHTTPKYENGCAGCGERKKGACDGGCRGFQNLRPERSVPCRPGDRNREGDSCSPDETGVGP